MKTNSRKCEPSDSRLIQRLTTGRPGHILFFILALFMVLSISMPSFAQDFTATAIGDYGNITVMEVTGNYDARNPDDSMNVIPRQEIAKEFLETHKDEYDFLVVFTNYDFQMLYDDTAAFYNPVKNDTQGIGQEIFDNSDLYGSSGKLQGMIDMGNISNLGTSPLDTKFEETIDILSHELMHRWGAYVSFEDTDASISSALIGLHDSHWSFLLDSDGSVMYGNDWQDNGDGTFTSLASRKYYSPLDLYLMGLYDKSQVPSMLLIDNPDIDPTRLSETGITINGGSRLITIDDIIAAEGERVPGPSGAQKTFKAAFILITAPGTFTGYEIYGLENIRNGWTTRFSILTDGQGIMQVALTQKDDLPSNPGIIPPSVDPRTLPPDINEGVTWLMNNQQANGSWMDLPETVSRDTSSTVLVLKNYDIASQNYSDGIQWLGMQSSGNMDNLSRKIETLVKSGQDVTSLEDELLSWQNTDGGWGSSEGYRSNSLDTSFVLKALSAYQVQSSEFEVQSAIAAAIEYLKAEQNTDGGWGHNGEESIIQATANVLSAFNKYKEQYQLDDPINSGIAWLLTKQNADGGFGNSPSTVYDSAVATIVLREFDISMDITNNSLNYILGMQSENGSWYESPYQTALAVSAVWKANVDPDLSVRADDITFIPATVDTIPSTIVINADIWNLGKTDVSQAKVALYDGAVSDQNKIGEQDLAFPGQSLVTVTFSVTITDGRNHAFRVTVDPENIVNESNEANNIAVKLLSPPATCDFEILDADVSVSQNPADMFQDVIISSRVTNNGTMNAYNVRLNYFIDEIEGPYELATVTVDIPAGTAIDNEIVWRTDRAGDNMAVTVLADPFGSFSELSETNNQAFTHITVNSSTEPDLTVSYGDITFTPEPANELGNVNISAVVRNAGFSDVSNIIVSFYNGVPGENGVLLGTETIESLSSGESVQVSITWTNIMDYGERIIYVQVDPDNMVAEIREDNNDAFRTLQVLGIPDLAISTNSIVFSPPAPSEGDQVAVNVTVQNAGEQTASNVTVRAYEGGVEFDSQSISQIPGNSEETASLVYDTTGRDGAHEITIIVDPDNTVIERSDGNNTASRTLGVQDGSLWLTEPSISPNGDGIKDSTLIFFRIELRQSVKIILVNEKGETVRTFSGGELEDVLGGSVLWDGLDDSGMVVDDGQYSIKLLDMNNGIMGMLVVIVDNNRSPLTDAVGTEYLLNNNLTCELPDIESDDWEWFADESGILFNIENANLNTPEYPTGIYSMAPDGEDILRIVPFEWNKGNDPTYDYYYLGYELSPDGEKMAFVVSLYNRLQGSSDLYELYVVDVDGHNMTLLESSASLQEYATLRDFKWSPDSSTIVYKVNYRYPMKNEMWIVQADGAGKTKIDDVDYVDIKRLVWAPDSAKIAYRHGYDDDDWNYHEQIRISDMSGNTQDVFSVNDYVDYIEWFDNQQIIMIEEYENNYEEEFRLWLVDSTGNGNNINISNSCVSGRNQLPVLNREENYFAYIDSDSEKLYVRLYSASGDIRTLHESPSVVGYESIGDLRLSPDHSKLAFIDFAYEEITSPEPPEAGCYYNGYLVVTDIAADKKTAHKVSDSLNACYVPYSYHIYTMEGGSWAERGVLHYNTRYETKELNLTRVFNDGGMSYQIRISQQGMDAAHLDHAALMVNGRLYEPTNAVNSLTGESVLQQVLSKDNNVADLHNATVDLEWDNLPERGRVSLVLNAREEDLGRREAYPFRYPANGYYTAELQGGAINMDGEITAEDNLLSPLFRKYSRPVTGHPEGYTYGFVKSDGVYLYGVLDFTPDNTVDSGGDWASMEVVTPEGIKTFLVSDSQQQYGMSSFTNTDKVPYPHKVYEFRIPLDEIGVEEAGGVSIAFHAYGTAGSGGEEIEYSRYSLRWMPDDFSLFAMDDNGAYILNYDNGEKVYLPIESGTVDVSPLGKYVTYDKYVDPMSVCYGRGYSDVWAMSSLLNLTADLRAVKNESYVELRGIAADLHFEGYKIEYADTTDPGTWSLVSPPSNVSVIDDVFTSWVPPYEGTFYVKLTVWDSAGNTAYDIERISWGLNSSITNIYRSLDIFSPNSDGVKDTVKVHYNVAEPVHLEFTISDENGQSIRTIVKDYSVPGEDYITWDGRDDDGMIVPDGVYTIEFYTYELFVLVDNTPPDIFAEFQPIEQNGETYKIYSELTGHAFDDNLQYWVIEYGEGENPVEWFQLKIYEDILVGEDEDGNPIMNPIGDASISRFIVKGADEWILGKKIRISAEDAAGNRSSLISNFIDEALILHSVDGILYFYDEPGRSVRGALNSSQENHSLGIILNLREEISDITVQHHTAGDEWVDGDVIGNPPFGNAVLDWERSLNIYATHIRLKATGVSGQEYYSNWLPDKFEVRACVSSSSIGCPYQVHVQSLLFEDLLNLRLQAISGTDPNYSSWTDIRVYDSGLGDIPIGSFLAACSIPNWNRAEAYGYDVKLIGTSVSGEEYEAIGSSSPCSTDSGAGGGGGINKRKDNFSIIVNHLEVGCGIISEQVSLSASMDIQGYLVKSLTYYIEYVPGIYETIRHFDLTSESAEPFVLDTGELPEGEYPVKAVLELEDPILNITSEKVSENVMFVDRILPDSQIAIPAQDQYVCPIEIIGSAGRRFGLEVEGEVDDNGDIAKYELFYGAGDNPDTWEKAVTWFNNDPDDYISGRVAVDERIDIMKETERTFSLFLRGVDRAGNVDCHVTTFHLEPVIHFTEISVDEYVFSPNGDGVMDEVSVGYGIDKDVSVEVKVFNIIQNENGYHALDVSAVRTIVSGLPFSEGTGFTVWDGRDDAGTVVQDGMYGITVIAGDTCGYINMQWVAVDVDTTPPVVSIDYPQSGDIIGNIVEIRGRTDDAHFEGYILEFGEGASPVEWTVISISDIPAVDGMLGVWNTSGQSEGFQTLRITARDTIGNSSSTVRTIDMSQRKTLITDLEAAPRVISPNNDGRRDFTGITYELTDACDVIIEIFNSSDVLMKSETTSTLSGGRYTIMWDGNDGQGSLVPDGDYSVRISAALSSDAAVTQEENITVIVDTSVPIVDIQQPASNSYLTDISIIGDITDVHLMHYSVTLTGDFGQDIIDSGSNSREDFIFGILHNLSEGDYVLEVTAEDLGENAAGANVPFTIDRTPPEVTLNAPDEGEYFGSTRDEVIISGTIIEDNLDTYAVRYSSSGESPWIDLIAGDTIPVNSQLYAWEVGAGDGIADGSYTVSLYTNDMASLETVSMVNVTIDNTVPLVSLVLPEEGTYVKEALDVTGTAFDTNIEEYQVELSQGICDSAYKWVILKKSNEAVQGGVLAAWDVLPADGDYCIKVTATDKVNNRVDTVRNIKVDTHPPGVPVLSAEIQDRTDVNLSWTQNSEPDLAGYNIYRNDQRVNPELITAVTYLDQNLSEGGYIYVVKAVDLAGWESDSSNEANIAIDLSGPNASIRSPRNASSVGGIVDIMGTAYSDDDFRQYRVYVGQGPEPAAWNLIRTSPLPVSYGVLAQWDTTGPGEDVYSVRLETEDISGNINKDQITVTIDNDPPLAPVLISALAGGQDVDVQWQGNTEPDLAGYLLFRNGRLVNVDGIVVGDLGPYLLNNTEFPDYNLPDGTYNYFLQAMDEAGNISAPSNTIEVSIDTRAPQAVITDPADGSSFEETVLVEADSEDLDIDNIQLQYKRAQDSAWTDLGSSLTARPYITYLDPDGLGLSYGDFNLRAVATDIGGQTDQSPSMITVTYADITAPAVPADLNTLTDGSDVTLSWTANTETDLDGYNIYRTESGVRTMINSGIISDITYEDAGLSDGDYLYEITAVDINGNESGPSQGVPAGIYAPVIAQPYTPTGLNTLQLTGGSASAGSSVEIFTDTGSGPVSQGTTVSDAEGDFMFDLSLTLGENRITAKCIDDEGNISRESDMVVVVYNEAPAAPVGLTAIVNGYDVNLTWTPNTEPDLSGYNMYRDGEKLNDPVALTEGSAAASSYYLNGPSNAFDGDLNTYWRSNYSYGTFNPAWLEIELPTPELISHITINWGSETSDGGEGGGYETLYAGVDYEIQVWTGYTWITHTVVTGNMEQVNSFDFSPSYRTDRIRIYITDTTDTNYSKHVRIVEVEILRDDLITSAVYDDINVSDGMHSYMVTAVDYYGFESAPSDEAQAGVGDVTPPSAPLDPAAAASGSDIVLDWTANSEADLAGYNVYRNDAGDWRSTNDSLVISETYTDEGLENGTYTYRITAVDNAGNESAPSDEASSEIYVAPPESPVILGVAPLSEGGALEVTWEYTNGTPDGYNLYRTAVSGGPYEEINSALLSGLSYLDEGLTNGVAYYYVVTALDSLGNESAYSNEAYGIPEDTVPPSIPDIFLPPQCLTVYEGTTDIRGTAEQGVSLELYRNGEYVAETSAVEEDTFHTFTFDFYIDSASASSDAKTLAYTQDESLWLMDMASGGLTQYAQEVYDPVWSPDGRKIVYTFYTSNWSSRLGIYDVDTETGEAITEDTESYFNEYDPSWSSDGNRLAYRSDAGGTYDIWLRDMSADTLTRITSGLNTYIPVISPDGQKIAYSISSTLYIVEIGSGVTTEVTDNAVSDYQYYAWSPESDALAYISNQNGQYDIYIFNIDQQSSRRVTSDSGVEAKIAWSPDGGSMAFERREPDWTRSLVTMDIQTLEGRIMYQSSSYFNYLKWAETGDIVFIQNRNLTIVEPAGQYGFTGVSLEPGENIFYVLAVDEAGNARSSDEGCVIYDTSLLPDLSVADEDIFVYPTYPVDGEMTSITVMVRNNGQAEAENVDIDIYIWDDAGALELLQSANIPSLAPQSGEQVGLLWDSAGKAGINDVIVFVDPEDMIEELNETNNLGWAELRVVNEEGVLMSMITDSNSYTGGQDVNIDINLINSGIAKDVTLEVRIEDADEYTVELLDTFDIHMTYGSDENFHYVWNTGATYSGGYSVHTVLSNSEGLISEDIVPFDLLPDTGLDLSVITDRSQYDIGETVWVSVSALNSGSNYVISELMLRIRITDGGGTEYYTEDRTLTNLLPGVSSSLGLVWYSGNNTAGDYYAEVEAFIGGQPLAGASALFGLNGSVRISGEIEASPSVISLGNEVRADYSVLNTGSEDVSGLIVKVLVVDPESGEVMDSEVTLTDLPMEAAGSGQVVFSTQGYELKTYTVRLQYIYQDITRSIASALFTVRDGTPPVVSLISPASGGNYTSTVSISSVVSDNASGIDRVEYMMDGGTWNLLPVSNPSQGRYLTLWTPTVLSDEGAHTLSVRATDEAGNTSEPLSVTFTIEFIPPFADAGPDRNVITGEFLTLDGSGSYDPEGEIISFLWTFRDVPSGSAVTDASLSDVTSAQPAFTTDVDGTYVAELTVSDGKKQDADTVAIIASTPNVDPNADAGPDQYVSTGSVAYLDGSGSYDPDSDPLPLSYIWSFNTVPVGSVLTDSDIVDRENVNASFIPDTDGPYVLVLTVSDGDLSSEDQVMIVSLTPNVPPNAAAGDDMSISSGEIAVLDGSASDDPDNGPGPLMFSWSFVAVPTGSSLVNSDISDADTAFPSFYPDMTGTYVLELMANDGLESSFDNIAVTVINISVISVTPTSIDFGDVDLGMISESRAITVTNEASAILVINDVNISGSGAGDFIYINDCSVIDEAESCIITVTFAPDSTGMKNALLNILPNDPNMPSIVVLLDGNGVDLTPPDISASANRETLWPPNHKMVDIVIDVETSDNSGMPVILSAEVQSNEPINGNGDGNTSPDWTEPVIDQDTGIINLQLRSERSGGGDGRIYTITITASDITNNSNSVNVEVTVPHNR